jgi:hypothetical protein
VTPDEPQTTTDAPPPAPILYVTDLTFDRFDPADLFDIAFLLRSPAHDLQAICLAAPSADRSGERILDALTVRAGREDVPYRAGCDGLMAALEAAPGPVNLVVVAGYGAVAEALARERALFRARVARLFVVGGMVNDYALPRSQGERSPIDPRLRERHPERFPGKAEPRMGGQGMAWGALLTSGEGVIWLPRDVCLWRYAARASSRMGERSPSSCCASCSSRTCAAAVRTRPWRRPGRRPWRRSGRRPL